MEPVRTPYEYTTTNWRNEETPFDFYIHGAISDCEPEEDGDESEYSRSAVGVAIVHGNPTGRDVAEATAAFIVNACNNHAALLAACEMWDQGFVEGEEFTAEEFRQWVNKNRATARAAIASVKGS